MMDNSVRVKSGLVANFDGAWHQVMSKREHDGQTEYMFFSKDYWIPEKWIKEFKNMNMRIPRSENI